MIKLLNDDLMLMIVNKIYRKFIRNDKNFKIK